MKTYTMIETKAQKEALINEFKGNLFEYLVASFMARNHKIERAFISSFGGAMKEQFSHYEQWLRQNEPELLKELPVLAQKTAQALDAHLPKDLQNILVMGKMAAGAHDMTFGECDIMAVGAHQQVPFSLKLCKGGAFVNTKSAGVKSFLSSYFSAFSMANKYQEEFSRFIDESFIRMGHELYHMAGLEFSGRFDSEWTSEGHSELPGQLPSPMQKVVLQTYYDLAQKLHFYLLELYKSDAQKFAACLWPLIGQRDNELIQATCFHKSIRKDGIEKKYQLSGLLVHKHERNDDASDAVEIIPIKDSISSFEIHFRGLILQIRIKPMNKFTTASYKVNCSIKEREIHDN